MLITLIAAVGKDNVIGLDGKIPWHIPRDFRFFKKITTGCPCIMGRKTFESLPAPLPERLNLVLSKKANQLNVTRGNVIAHSNPYRLLAMACRYAENNASRRIVIMGGEGVYEKYMSIAHELLITRVNYSGEGDTFFPGIPENYWKLVESNELTDSAVVERWERRRTGVLASMFS